MTGRKDSAVFLDRDGTIIEEVGYLDSLEKMRLIPGAAAAVRRLNEAGFKAVVVTNQSGVARGYFDEIFVEAAHARLRDLLAAAGAFLDAVYFCPHHPAEGRGDYVTACDCRKPAPGLIFRAAAELSLELSRSYMIGDGAADLEAARRAGIKGILVRTGYGGQTEALLEAQGARPLHIARDLLEAVEWLLKDRRT